MSFFLQMAVFGIAAVVLETTLLADFPAASLRFDFMIVSVAAVAFAFEWRRGLPIVIFYGLIVDAASAGPFGMSVFSYLIVYAFIRTIIANISFQAGLGLLFWVAIVSLVDKAMCLLVLAASTGDMTIPRIIISRAPAQALLDAAVGMALVPLLRWYWGITWEKLTKPNGLVLK